MPLVNMVEILQKARDGKYAVAQLNVNNLEWIQAVLEAAQVEKSPIIIGVSEGAGQYMGGPEVVVAMVKTLMNSMKITVPVAIHLDHGSSFEACKQAIDAGFTSVMIDKSHFPIDENIEMTAKVVEYAHARGVSVEGEVGTVGGTEDGVTGGVNYADGQECKRLFDEAGVDALAAALGSVHGPYEGEPVLGFTEMSEISKLTGAPLVLHGGSGIPIQQVKKAIEFGHCKVNVNTELQQVWTQAVRQTLNGDQNIYDPRKIIKPGKDAIFKTARETLVRFGSSGKGSH